MYTIGFVLGNKHIPFTTDSLDDFSFPTELEYNGNFYQLTPVDKNSFTGIYREIIIKSLFDFSIKNNLKRIRDMKN